MVVGAAVEDYIAMDDDVGHPQSLEGSQRGIPEAAEIEDSREITGKLDDQNACFFVDSHAMNLIFELVCPLGGHAIGDPLEGVLQLSVGRADMLHQGVVRKNAWIF